MTSLDRAAWALCIGFAMLGLAVIFLMGVSEGDGPPPVPSCQEDEIINGAGDYSDGYWETYVCVHPDTVADEVVSERYCYQIEQFYSDGLWSDGVLSARATCMR